jgi:hypothetical protein
VDQQRNDWEPNMTRDDIIRMADQAFDESSVTNLEVLRFAALVAAAEREKVARWQIGSGYSTGHGETIEDLLTELEWQVRESEREACAKVAEAYEPRCDTCPSGVANAIRARGTP